MDHSRMNRRCDRIGYALCLVLVLYVTYRWGLTFFDPYLQNDDARTSVFPYWSLHQDLFGTDYISRAMSMYTTWLVKAGYYLLTLKIDLLYVTKIVQLAALVWACYHLFRIGQQQAGGCGALFALYLGLHTWELLRRSGGGHPRAFAMPVILMCAHGIIKGNQVQAGAAAVLGFALYPPAGLMVLGAFVIWQAVRIIRERKEKSVTLKRLLFSGLTLLFCFGAVLPAMLQGKAEFGRLHSYEQAVNMPEFGMDGRLWVIPLPNLAGQVKRVVRKLALTSDDSPVPSIEKWNERTKLAFLAAVALAGLLTVSRMTSFSPVVIYLAASGVILFYIAKVFAFHLYSPARMIFYTLPCAYLVFMVFSFTGIGRDRYGGTLRRFSALVACLLFTCFQGIAFKGPVGIEVNARNQQELFQAVQKFPKDTLLAGHPERLNNIPLWGKRQVLITYETCVPWLDRTWEESRRRIYDVFSAYYADSPAPVRHLHETYGVRYMVVHEADLSPDYTGHCKFFEPFGSHLETLCQKPANHLIWHKVPPASLVDRASGFMIIDLESFLKTVSDSLSEDT